MTIRAAQRRMSFGATMTTIAASQTNLTNCLGRNIKHWKRTPKPMFQNLYINQNLYMNPSQNLYMNPNQNPKRLVTKMMHTTATTIQRKLPTMQCPL